MWLISLGSLIFFPLKKNRGGVGLVERGGEKEMGGAEGGEIVVGM